MKNWKNIFIYLGLVLLVWVVQNAHLLWGFAKYNSNETEFTSFVYKGSMGFAMDNTAYGNVLQHSLEKPTLFRSDNLVFENKDERFADGQLVILFATAIYHLCGDLDITVLVTSFLSIALSILLLIRILRMSFNSASWLLTFLAVTFVLLTGVDDYFGVIKALNNWSNNHFYTSFGMHLGYANRFPYAQVSLPFFLFWIFALLLFIRFPKTPQSLLLGISLVILQYSYFYYWTFAIFITGAFLFTQLKEIKKWFAALLVYGIFTLPFWLNFFAFNQTEFAAEYLNRVKGLEYYPSLSLHVVGVLLSLTIYRDQRILPAILAISSIIGLQCLIEFIEYTFQDYHWMYWLSRFFFVAILLLNFIWVQKKVKISTIEYFILFNYWAIFLFINLKFLIGINVQPYHWVYTTFHPIFGLSIAWLLLQVISLRKTIIISAGLLIAIATYNGICFGNTAGKYWKLNSEETAVIEFVHQAKNPVIIGNNYPFLITIAAQSTCDLYMGTSNNKLSNYEESYFRFISNFKAMGYSDSTIFQEYDKHYTCDVYKTKYAENGDSLHTVWPDNTLLTAETLHHYFLKPEEYRSDLEMAVNQYNAQQFELKKDLIIIYKPTFLGDYNAFKTEPILDSPNFRIYSTD